MSEMIWLSALVVSMVLALRWPLVGFCLVYPMMLLCPLRFESIPVVSTPFGILAVFTAATALLVIRRSRLRLFTRPILVPYFLMVSVLLILGLSGYGSAEAAAFRVRLYLVGMWPFVLAWLIFRTRRDAFAVMFAMVASSIALGGEVLWLILTRGQEALAGSQEQSLRILADENKAMQPINYITMMVVALCSTIVLSLALDGGWRKRWRLSMLGAWALMAGTVLLAPYASPIVALALATGFLMVLRLFKRGRRVLGYALLALVILGGGVLVYRIPSVKQTMGRIGDPSADASASWRMKAFVEEPLAFLESPLIGNGAAIDLQYTPAGHMLVGHTSFLRDASQWGLVFMIPFFAMLVVVGRQYLKLLKRVKAPVDVAVARAMFVSYLVAIVVGAVVTPTFGEIAQDTVFWTCTAVVLFWNQYADANPGAPFLVWKHSRGVVA